MSIAIEDTEDQGELLRMRPHLLLAILWVTSICAAGERQTEEGGHAIPISKVFALGMPGTSDLDELLSKSAEKMGRKPFLAERITRALTARPNGPMQSLVVSGPPELAAARAFTALQKADGLFDKKSTVFGTEVQLVFCRFVSSYEAEIVSVTQKGRETFVEYRFVPSSDPQATVDFALIPLGDLPAGEYSVKFQQLPLEPKYVKQGFVPVEKSVSERLVPGDTIFEVAATVDGDTGQPVLTPTLGAAGDEGLVALDEVWALDMPRTRDVRELDPASFGRTPRDLAEEQRIEVARRYRSSSVVAIKNALNNGPLRESNTPQAFAVTGTGKTALENFERIASGQCDVPETVPADQSISVIFYSLPSGYYVHLDRVQQVGPANIEITYRLVPHMSRASSVHFAIIPIHVKGDAEQLVVSVKPPVHDKLFSQWGLPPATRAEVKATVSQSNTMPFELPE
ncbi:hypothetical protein [Aeoliella sp. SH292]|uniref:hypothetical protein n=1 Tax=Aeoliella sp. SH292 TaxID=3454464 RepID=UPI003F9473DA